MNSNIPFMKFPLNLCNANSVLKILLLFTSAPDKPCICALLKRNTNLYSSYGRELCFVKQYWENTYNTHRNAGKNLMNFFTNTSLSIRLLVTRLRRPFHVKTARAAAGATTSGWAPGHRQPRRFFDCVGMEMFAALVPRSSFAAFFGRKRQIVPSSLTYTACPSRAIFFRLPLATSCRRR